MPRARCSPGRRCVLTGGSPVPGTRGAPGCAGLPAGRSRRGGTPRLRRCLPSTPVGLSLFVPRGASSSDSDAFVKHLLCTGIPRSFSPWRCFISDASSLRRLPASLRSRRRSSVIAAVRSAPSVPCRLPRWSPAGPSGGKAPYPSALCGGSAPRGRPPVGGRRLPPKPEALMDCRRPPCPRPWRVLLESRTRFVLLELAFSSRGFFSVTRSRPRPQPGSWHAPSAPPTRPRAPHLRVSHCLRSLPERAAPAEAPPPPDPGWAARGAAVTATCALTGWAWPCAQRSGAVGHWRRLSGQVAGCISAWGSVHAGLAPDPSPAAGGRGLPPALDPTTLGQGCHHAARGRY